MRGPRTQASVISANTIRLATAARLRSRRKSLGRSLPGWACAVIVPTYGDERAADLARQALQTVFPDREIIPLPSLAVLSGGGSFHCISQQEPA